MRQLKSLKQDGKTTTNEQNGKFTIHHPPGVYTLKIDAYGFEPKTEQVTLTEKGVITPTITLRCIPNSNSVWNSERHLWRSNQKRYKMFAG